VRNTIAHGVDLCIYAINKLTLHACVQVHGAWSLAKGRMIEEGHFLICWLLFSPHACILIAERTTNYFVGCCGEHMLLAFACLHLGQDQGGCCSGQTQCNTMHNVLHIHKMH